jgi:hypothetical protein
MRSYRQAVVGLAVLMVALGLAMIVVTLAHGFGVGLLLGVLFVAAGLGRLKLMRR